MFPHPGKRGIAGAGRPIWMGMEEKRTELEIDPRTVRDALAQEFDAEVFGLE
jgi:hypothetical protein